MWIRFGSDEKLSFWLCLIGQEEAGYMGRDLLVGSQTISRLLFM
jgi:hypothetical protein